MPKIKTTQTKKTPQGFLDLEPQLLAFKDQMDDIVAETTIGKRKEEANWGIYKLSHQRSRLVFDLFYLKKEISRELYEYLLRENHADKHLIAKWKKQGYEKLCCMQCVQQNTNFGGVCVCRVPKKNLDNDKLVQCVVCGCRGCASCD